MINYHLLADTHSIRYNFETVRPYRHLIIDGFLTNDVAEEICATFPEPDKMKIRDNDHSLKLYLRDHRKLGPIVKALFEEFATERFLRLLCEITGIPELHADPFLQGAGLHQGANGSYLDVHADFNFHEPLQMHRRLNILIYFNREWKREYNGYLEAWDRELKYCKMIKPSFNRCVLIETTETSYHGYLRLDVPDGVTRKSLAGYFYTPTRPAQEIVPPHGTLWRQRPASYEVECIE